MNENVIFVKVNTHDMKITFETLAAVYKLSVHLASADGEVSDNEVRHLFEFFQKFEGLDQDTAAKIMEYGEAMENARALQVIREADDEARQEIANVFAKTVCEDELTEEERSLYLKISEYCNLPAPVDDSEPEPEPEEDDEDAVIPSFFSVDFYGMVAIHQSKAEDWNTLGDELAQWIGADRVEVVRYTRPLNALTEQLRLNGRHLVFMVARNGYGDRTVGDNMPATILYGGGYPLYGNIVFALETDNGYKIEGIRSRNLFGAVVDAVNNAVDGLLRFPEQ